MSEAEYDLLLDTVRAAIEIVPERDFVPTWMIGAAPEAANDNNDHIRPLFPPFSGGRRGAR